MNSTPSDVLENITVRLGRTKKYLTSDEQIAAQRHNSLIHYHRKKKLRERIRELESERELQDGDIIDVHISIRSRVLGDYEEDLQYRIINKDQGLYQKI